MGYCIYGGWKRYDKSSERREGSTRRRKKPLKTFDGSEKRSGEKDMLLGLPSEADARIGAFAEWVKADFLIRILTNSEPIPGI